MTNGPVLSSPALSDLDQDGDIEIIIGSDDGFVYVWDAPGDFNTTKVPWSMFRGNPTHHGVPDDYDGDGLINSDEVVIYRTDPIWFDTDGDSLGDGREALIYFTDPLRPDSEIDSDRDGLTNVDEADRYFTDPLLPDKDVDNDYDGLTNVDEADIYGTNPKLIDSDWDGVNDGKELQQGTDPLIPQEIQNLRLDRNI